MATTRFTLSLVALAAAATPATGQVSDSVTITGRSVPAISGFGTQPLARSPLQATVLSAADLADGGIASLAGITGLDASVSDAYNAEGYWSFLSVRGFVLDNRSNFRRDGLPINAETAITLINKERVEVLKGTSGVQSGVSAPGGLVNLVVKRPTEHLRVLRLDVQQGGSIGASVDLSERFGKDHRFGLRLNAGVSELKPQTGSADGQRRAFALAGDWQLTPDSRLEAEFESSHQSQPSVPGFSLRGDTLPDARTIDPRINLNNQPWSLPVVLDGDTVSLRWRQPLSADWHFTAHGASQRLRSDDRIAFPFGCYDAGADRYYAGSYCPDGSFDLYDFRSEGERRRVDALDLQFSGVARTGPIGHEISAGVLISRQRLRFQQQAFNYAGTATDDGLAVTPPAPDLIDDNTNRDESSTEWYVRDAMQITPRWALWAGLRHTRLQRESVRTDGVSERIDYAQAFTTPWLALVHQWTPATMVYASWGQGIETDVVPNRPRYLNSGQVLPALKSQQTEIGLKHVSGPLDWSLAAFSISRPMAVDDPGDCAPSCVRRIDGDVRHRGIEGAITARLGAWSLRGSAMWLDAQRQGSSTPAGNGLQPTNVPTRTLKAQAAYQVAAVPGLSLQAGVVHEGPRMVLPDNSVQAPAWTRWDLAARWQRPIAGVDTVWQLAVDNVADTRAWRETPYQFGHAYLFPLAPRTWRASVQMTF